MSNLIKSRYVYVNEVDKKVIDTNEKSEKFRVIHLERYERNNSFDETSATLEEGTFQEGLKATVVNIDSAMDAEETRLSYEQLVVNAQEEAEQIIKNALEEAEAKSKLIYEEAKENGYKDGLNKGMNEVALAKEELEVVMEEHNASYQEQILTLEPKFAHIVSVLVEKITGIVVEDKKEVIKYLIHNALLNSDVSKNLIIRISKEDYDYVITKRDELILLVGENTNLEIVKDMDLSKNQCTIETDSSVIDCSLDVELDNLIQNIKLLAISKD